MTEEKTKTYSLMVRNKWITEGCRSIDEFITAYQGMIDQLREWKALGIKLDLESNIDDDYAVFITSDEKIAQQEGFEQYSDVEFDDYPF